MSTIALIAGDAGPSLQLSFLKEFLESKGVSTRIQLAKDKTKIPISELLFDTDAVILGMAASEIRARHELQIFSEARTRKIPIFLYADTFGVAERPWFKDVLHEAKAVFVVTESEAVHQRGLRPDIRFIVTGNPLWWRMRKRAVSVLDARAAIGAKENERVILFGGTKQELADLHAVGQLVNACLADPSLNALVVYTLHPGSSLFEDVINGEVCVQRIFDQIVRVPLNKSNRVRAVFAPVKITTNIVQCGADLVIESMSSTGIIAALRQQPLMTFMSPMFRKHLQSLNGNIRYPLVDEGASELASLDHEVLRRQIWELIENSPLRRRQLKNQKKFLSIKRDPCELMCEVLDCTL